MSIFGSVMSRAVLRERCLRLRRSSKTNVEARLPYGIGSNRRENITDWALNEFRTHYSDPNITKWDIFHYVYAVLHHPEYRERYAANLKRELPRIPFVTGTADPSPPPPNDGGSARDDNPRNLGAPSFAPAVGAKGGSQNAVLGYRSSGRAGLQPGGNAAVMAPSSLPKASAEPASAERDTIVAQGVSPGSVGIDHPESLQGRHILSPKQAAARSTAAHHKETAGPSTRADALARDDRVGGEDRGPSTPAAQPQAASAQDDKQTFWAFANAGDRLADLHVNYEQQPEYPLERIEKGQLNWRVEKMRLGKDKTSLIYNEFLTLRGIPPQTYEYRLGNRSALEWVIDQYQVSTDKRSGIVNDPNRADDPEYIVRLIGQVIGVSLATMEIVKSLPPLVTDSIPL